MRWGWPLLISGLVVAGGLLAWADSEAFRALFPYPFPQVRPRGAFRPNCFGRQARIFNVLSDLQANRFEELNNYSGPLTRRKYDDSGGIKP